MSDKIRMSFEDACKLAFRSVEIGNTKNALEIMDEVSKQIDSMMEERDELKTKLDQVFKKSHNLIIPLSDDEPKDILEVREITINSCQSHPDSQTTAQVHMAMCASGVSCPLVIRFKNPQDLDRLIMVLQRHYADVWPRENQG